MRSFLGLKAGARAERQAEPPVPPCRIRHSAYWDFSCLQSWWDRHSACHALLAIMLWFGAVSLSRAATFGSIVMIDGGVSDLVLDEARNRLYLVNSPQNRIEIYDVSKRQLLSPVATSGQPLSAALSLDGQSLYVTDYGASTLDIINLSNLMTVSHVSLSSAPEGVAVGGDGRVLITTAGTSSSANNLMLYDPSSGNLTAISIAPPAPTTAGTAPTSGRVYITSRSHLETSHDGRFIIGMNNPSTTTRQVFVYEVASGSVVRSRSVSSISSVLAVSPDGSRFMAGLTLFDSMSLTVIAQQNAANSNYLFPTNVNFNTQANQGGSVFSPDGLALYSAFNIAPVQTPAAAADVSQFMFNDPDNLLINLALQMQENLAGKMVITSDSKIVYAISQSGFLILPVSTVYSNPIAAADTNVVLLENDQCGVTAQFKLGMVNIHNQGQGQLTVTATLQSSTANAQTPPLAGAPGGMQFPGVPIFVIGGPGGTTSGPGPGGPGGPVGIPPIGTATPVATASSTAPTLEIVQTDSGPALQFTYNSNNASSLGTVTPHDFAVQALQAINIPPRIRVYQNNRNAEAAGTILPVPVGVSTSEGLMDIVSAASRHLLFIANSGLNRVEVFDTQAMQFLNPIKVGQLPHSLALSPDGGMLYVANTGGENISIIDTNQLKVTGQLTFPSVPFNASFGIATPRQIAVTQSGLQAVMSDGTNNTLWESIGNQMTPRGVSPVMGTTSSGAPATVTSPYSLMATPEGAFAILLDGSGNAYLYDASSDQYVNKQQVFSTPIQGYYGPIGAAASGQYFLVNGAVLNQALTQIATAGTTIAGNATIPRPVSAVTPINTNFFARFVQPVRTGMTATVSFPPTIELVAAASGITLASVNALEGPLSTQTGTMRVNVPGRTMAVDAAVTNAFLLTTSGLSIIPLPGIPTGGPMQGTGGPGGPPIGFPGGPPTSSSNGNGPQVNQNGVVSLANYQSSPAPDSVASIFGSNLASSATYSSTPLPDILGGVCITLNNSPLPILATSSSQINVQIPPTLAAGKYPLLVRSIASQTASPSQMVTVSKYAPAVIVDPSTGLASIYHADGSPVTKDKPATRDEKLTVYASGLGPTTGGTVTAGQPSPDNPLAVTGKVSVYFGPKGYSQAPMIVNWSGLAPGLIGVYRINVTVPGIHLKGDQLPVTISVGGVSSPTTGSNPPYVALD
jgi:uncharacterized protein (TIGR03437 family)